MEMAILGERPEVSGPSCQIVFQKIYTNSPSCIKNHPPPILHPTTRKRPPPQLKSLQLYVL